MAEAWRPGRIKRALAAMRDLDATETMVVMQALMMDWGLKELNVPAAPTTRAPRAAIAAPAPDVHQLATAAPSLQLVRGGGRNPADDWADVPGSWSVDA